MGKQPPPCEQCGYTKSQDHDQWCPSLHPAYWSWYIKASSGPFNRRKTFYEGETDDLVSLFRVFIGDENKHRQKGPFTLEISHLLRHPVGRGHSMAMSYASYSVNFERGRAMWGNYQPQMQVGQAWKEAGGIYREQQV